MRIEPVKRATASMHNWAAARFTGSVCFFLADLGLAPQALCSRLLRRLTLRFCAKTD